MLLPNGSVTPIYKGFFFNDFVYLNAFNNSLNVNFKMLNFNDRKH